MAPLRPRASAARAALLAALLAAAACGFRIVDLDAGAPRAAARFRAYALGAAARGGGAAAAASAERLNEGSAFTFAQPNLLRGVLPRQDCPRMLGPFNDTPTGAPAYYCSARGAGYCDRRSGACFCFDGYAGADCGECAAAFARNASSQACERRVRCPGDCSGAGRCDERSGACLCERGRRGVDCALRRCRAFDRWCAECSERACERCEAGYFWRAAVAGGGSGRCISCTRHDPRCVQCDAAACTACADPLLGAVRRSGRRRADATLAVDEAHRALASVPYGARDEDAVAAAFADAETLLLARDAAARERAGVEEGQWSPAGACAAALAQQQGASALTVRVAAMTSADAAAGIARKYRIACAPPSDGGARRDVHWGYGAAAGAGGADALRALAPSSRALAALARFGPALRGLAGALPLLDAEGRHPLRHLDTGSPRAVGAAATLTRWLACVADVLALALAATVDAAPIISGNLSSRGGGWRLNATVAQRLLDVGLLQLVRGPALELPIRGAPGRASMSVADTLLPVLPSLSWNEAPEDAVGGDGAPRDVLHFDGLYVDAAAPSSSLSAMLAELVARGGGDASAADIVAMAGALEDGRLPLPADSPLAAVMAALRADRATAAAAATETAHPSAASNATLALLQQALQNASDSANGAGVGAGAWSEALAAWRVQQAALARPIVSEPSERAAAMQTVALLAQLMRQHAGTLLLALVPSNSSCCNASSCEARCASSRADDHCADDAGTFMRPAPPFPYELGEGIAEGAHSTSMLLLLARLGGNASADAHAMLQAILAGLGGGDSPDSLPQPPPPGTLALQSLLRLRMLTAADVNASAAQPPRLLEAAQRGERSTVLLSPSFTYADASVSPQEAAALYSVLPPPGAAIPDVGLDSANASLAAAGEHYSLLSLDGLPSRAANQTDSSTLRDAAMVCDQSLALLPLHSYAARSGALPAHPHALGDAVALRTWMRSNDTQATLTRLALFYLAGAGPTAAQDPLLAGLLAAWDDARGDAMAAQYRRSGLLSAGRDIAAALESLAAADAEGHAWRNMLPELARGAAAASGSCAAVLDLARTHSSAGASPTALSALATLHEAHRESYAGTALLALPVLAAHSLSPALAGGNACIDAALSVLALAGSVSSSSFRAPTLSALAQSDVWSCHRVPATHIECGAPGVFSFASPRYAVVEGERLLRVTVQRGGGGLGRVTVEYELEHVTTDDADVAPTLSTHPASQHLVFEPGVVALSLLIPIFDDALVEGGGDGRFSPPIAQYLELDAAGVVVCDASSAPVWFPGSAVARPPAVSSGVPAPGSNGAALGAGRPLVRGLSSFPGSPPFFPRRSIVAPLIDGPNETSASWSRLYTSPDAATSAPLPPARRGAGDILHNAATSLSSSVDGEEDAESSWHASLGPHETFHLRLLSPCCGASLGLLATTTVAIIDDDGDRLAPLQSSATGALTLPLPPPLPLLSQGAPGSSVDGLPCRWTDRGCLQPDRSGVQQHARGLAAQPFATVGTATTVTFAPRDIRGELITSTRLGRVFTCSQGAPANGTILAALLGDETFIVTLVPLDATATTLGAPATLALLDGAADLGPHPAACTNSTPAAACVLSALPQRGLLEAGLRAARAAPAGLHLALPRSVSAVASYNASSKLYEAVLVPASSGAQVVAVQHALPGGLSAAYFATADMLGAPIVSRIDPLIAFRWGEGPLVDLPHCSSSANASRGSAAEQAAQAEYLDIAAAPIPLSGGLAEQLLRSAPRATRDPEAACSGRAFSEGAAARWSGRIQAVGGLQTPRREGEAAALPVEPDGDGAGEYTFLLVASGGARLWLDGELLIDSWESAGSHPDGAPAGTTTTPAELRMPVPAALRAVGTRGLDSVLERMGLLFDPASTPGGGDGREGGRSTRASATVCTYARLGHHPAHDDAVTAADSSVSEHGAGETAASGPASWDYADAPGMLCLDADADADVASDRNSSSWSDAMSAVISQITSARQDRDSGGGAASEDGRRHPLFPAPAAAAAHVLGIGQLPTRLVEAQETLTRMAHVLDGDARTAGALQRGRLLAAPRARVRLLPGTLHEITVEYHRSSAAYAACELLWVTPAMQQEAALARESMRARSIQLASPASSPASCDALDPACVGPASAEATRAHLHRLAVGIVALPLPVPSQALYSLRHVQLAPQPAAAYDAGAGVPTASSSACPLSDANSSSSAWPAASIAAPPSPPQSTTLRRSPHLTYVHPGAIAAGGADVLPRRSFWAGLQPWLAPAPPPPSSTNASSSSSPLSTWADGIGGFMLAAAAALRPVAGPSYRSHLEDSSSRADHDASAALLDAEALLPPLPAPLCDADGAGAQQHRDPSSRASELEEVVPGLSAALASGRIAPSPLLLAVAATSASATAEIASLLHGMTATGTAGTAGDGAGLGTYACGAGLHRAIAGLPATFSIFPRDASGSPRGVLGALDVDSIVITATSLLCDPLVALASLPGGDTGTATSAHVLGQLPRCASPVNSPADAAIILAGAAAAPGSRAVLLVGAAALPADANASLTRWRASTLARRTRQLFPPVAHASLLTLTSRCSPGLGSRSGASTGPASAARAAAALEASLLAGHVGCLAVLPGLHNRSVSSSKGGDLFALKRSVASGSATFDPVHGRLDASWTPLVAGTYALSVAVRSPPTGVLTHVIGSPFVVAVDAAVQHAAVSDGVAETARATQPPRIAVSARLTSVMGSGVAAAANISAGALFVAVQPRDANGNALTFRLAAEGECGSGGGSRTCPGDGTACADAVCPLVEGADEGALSSEADTTIFSPRQLLAAGAKLLAATHPAIRHLQVLVRPTFLGGNASTSPPPLPPVSILALALPVLAPALVTLRGSSSGNCSGGGGGGGAVSRSALAESTSTLSIAGAALRILSAPLVPTASWTAAGVAGGVPADGQSACATTSASLAEALPLPPLADALGRDAYLETAGLPAHLRNAVLAARARTYALVWVGAYTPTAAGRWGVAVAYARSGEHAGESPYSIDIGGA